MSPEARSSWIPLLAIWLLWAVAMHVTLPGGLHPMALAVLVAPLLILALDSGRRVVPDRRGVTTLLTVATPIALLLVLAGRTLGDWWLYDDPCLLSSALRHGVKDHFLDPAVWRSLSGNVLMPWMILSLSFDGRVLGLDPAIFYAHHLLSFVLLLGFLGWMLREYLSPLATALALSWFTASAAAVGVSWRLMNRHYLEGALFTLVALELFRRAVKDGRPLFALVGSGFYGVATTAKEVFVPLVILLPFLPVGKQRDRVWFSAPYVLVAVVYVLWRFRMLGLGNSLSGYSAGLSTAFPENLGLREPWQILWLVLLVGAGLFHVTRQGREIARWALLVALVLVLPLVPILERLEPRHFLLPTLALAVVLAHAAEPALKRRPVVGVALGLFLVGVQLHTLGQARFVQHRDQTVEEYRGEGLFVFESEEPGYLLSDLDNTTYLGCLSNLRLLAGDEPGPGYCGDPCWCGEKLPVLPTWALEDGEVRSQSLASGQSCLSTRPLAVEMRYDHHAGRLSWSFGPYSDGNYEVLLVEGVHAPGISVPFPLGRQGETPWTLTRPLRWIVRYRSPEGWQTYSPIFELRPPKEDTESVRIWQRGELAESAGGNFGI